MFRFIGFLVGFSLASIGLLFLVDTSSALRTRDAAVTLIESIDVELPTHLVSTRGQAALPVAPHATSAPNQVMAAEVETPPAPETLGDGVEPVPQPEETQTPTKPQATETTTAPRAPTRAIQKPDTVPRIALDQTPARHWYVFWSPFGSEYAASGFAERLTGLTGLDFTVIRERPGEYQVAFAYADESERSAGLAMIETQTGLRLQAPKP